MFQFIKRLFGKPEIKEQKGTTSLKWPSPIAQMVLDDLDKCPAWEWYVNGYFHHVLDYQVIKFRQHPYLSYQLNCNFSIRGVLLNNNDEKLIKEKFHAQLSERRKSLSVTLVKEELAKIGFDYKTVEPWLTQYH